MSKLETNYMPMQQQYLLTPPALTHPLIDLQQKPHMSCEVVFGSPSANCRGTGICKIMAKHKGKPSGPARDCSASTGVLSRSDNGNSVDLLLLREWLCVNALRRHLSGNMLELKEPCPLPSTIINALGLSFKVLPPGCYPIEIGRGWFKIHFHSSSHFINN